VRRHKCAVTRALELSLWHAVNTRFLGTGQEGRGGATHEDDVGSNIQMIHGCSLVADARVRNTLVLLVYVEGANKKLLRLTLAGDGRVVEVGVVANLHTLVADAANKFAQLQHTTATSRTMSPRISGKHSSVGDDRCCTNPWGWACSLAFGSTKWLPTRSLLVRTLREGTLWAPWL